MSGSGIIKWRKCSKRISVFTDVKSDFISSNMQNMMCFLPQKDIDDQSLQSTMSFCDYHGSENQKTFALFLYCKWFNSAAMFNWT